MSSSPVKPEHAASAARVSYPATDDYWNPDGETGAIGVATTPSTLGPCGGASAADAASAAASANSTPRSVPDAPTSAGTRQEKPDPPHSSPHNKPRSNACFSNYADQNQYLRGPGVPRCSGPSLLTLALASARDKPPSGQSDLPRANTEHPYHHLGDKVQDRTASHTLDDDTRDQSDGDVLTPRGSPRMRASDSSSSTPFAPVRPSNDMTMTAVHPRRNVVELRVMGPISKGHRDLYSFRTERDQDGAKSQERPSRSGRSLYGSDDHSAYNAHISTDSIPQHVHFYENTVEASNNARQTEKAWSIGAGELVNSQDGQVEKSISEVLAGVEPNARSRKASHSLRFFKEGLPDEKGRRRESRQNHHLREKLLSTGRAWVDANQEEVMNDLRPSSSQPLSDEVEGSSGPGGRLARTQSCTHTSGTGANGKSSETYFLDPELRKLKNAQIDTRDGELEKTCLDASTKLQGNEDRRHKTRLHTHGPDAEESGEDGDESGEEKISSAVFLPHQGPEQSQDHSATHGQSPRPVTGGRGTPHNEDFHPWLVKADELEADIEEVENEEYNHEQAIDHADSVTEEAESVPGPIESFNLKGKEIGPLLSRPFGPVSGYYEDYHVYGHQLAREQPLEAIELIPYKHQVGGHTTLWRFSKRAVCKQLNNRENEFYEKVEKYDRDLLAFLPRYIGVLNVTFQKQARRKSTVKRDDGFAADGKLFDLADPGPTLIYGSTAHEGIQSQKIPAQAQNGHNRVISQSMQSAQVPIPTVTFVDNQHILPRSFLQPTPAGSIFQDKVTPAAVPWSFGDTESNSALSNKTIPGRRPVLEDRHSNSWGATTVNKRLRNEVFNDAFLKQPVAIQRHRRYHQRVPRQPLPSLKPSSSTSNLAPLQLRDSQSDGSGGELHVVQSHSDLSTLARARCGEDEPQNGKDVTGTSAPEPGTIGESSPALKKKRRHSGSVVRRKPKDVRESRGSLKLFQEPDEAGCRAHVEDACSAGAGTGLIRSTATKLDGTTKSETGSPLPTIPSGDVSLMQTPMSEYKIPRPINPKEALTQRDSRVEYFLLLEDLTAGMKRPCIMDLKMGTRQYGVEANPKKQKSQQGKCAKTTSRELGVRVCGLQVWDVKAQSYEFSDKYYGRNIKAGREFQDALTRFLYNGVDPSSILRHIPTILQKLSQLELIISRLRGYRFYAASLLMFYDGDTSEPGSNGDQYDTTIEGDSTTDFATDTEDVGPRKKKNRRQIDFKMADFANCVAGGNLAPATVKPCPPKHPDEPDRGFLRGLRSLRMYFFKIQRDTRAQMGLWTSLRNRQPSEREGEGRTEDETSVSE